MAWRSREPQDHKAIQPGAEEASLTSCRLSRSVPTLAGPPLQVSGGSGALKLGTAEPPPKPWLLPGNFASAVAAGGSVWVWGPGSAGPVLIMRTVGRPARKEQQSTPGSSGGVGSLQNSFSPHFMQLWRLGVLSLLGQARVRWLSISLAGLQHPLPWAPFLVASPQCCASPGAPGFRPVTLVWCTAVLLEDVTGSPCLLSVTA